MPDNENIRILFLTKGTPKDAVSRMWFYGMADLLRTRGFDTSINTFEHDEYDVIFINRLNHRFIFEALERCPDAHIGVLFAELHPDPELVRNIDFFTLHTFMMREITLTFDRRLYRSWDYWDAAGKEPKAHSASNDLVLGFHGNPSHYSKDFFPHVAGALQDLAKKYRFKLKIVTKNVDTLPRIDGIETEVIEWELETYERELATFDIGLCPCFADIKQLAEPSTYIRNPNRINLLLFWGIPSVCSPIPECCHRLVHGETAFFAVGREAWRDALERLITQPDLRNHIGDNGRTMVLDTCTADVVADEFADALRKEMTENTLPKLWLQGGESKTLESQYRRYATTARFKKFLRKPVKFFRKLTGQR